MDQFLNTDFWRAFVSEGLAAFLGILFGIPAGLWVERRRARHATAERRLQIFTLLRDSLEKNQALLSRMRTEVKPDIVIFYNVDTTILESTASLKYELFDDVALNRLLEDIRYELQHLHRKIELQLEIEYGSFKAMSTYLETRQTLIDSIVRQLQPVSAKILEAIALMDRHQRMLISAAAGSSRRWPRFWPRG